MKTVFLERILKWNNIPVLILLLLFSCENQFESESGIQRAILQDEDFIDMMAEVFIMKREGDNDDLKSVNSERYLARINSYYDILSKRYNDFDLNVQKVLADKRTLDYNSYAEKLYNRILSILSKTSSKTTVAYDGPSVCGKPNCGGDNAHDIAVNNSVATACISGAYYSEFYCTTHNMGQCEAMRDATVNFCCDSYCGGNNLE